MTDRGEAEGAATGLERKRRASKTHSRRRSVVGRSFVGCVMRRRAPSREEKGHEPAEEV